MNITHNLRCLSNLTKAIEVQNNVGYLESCNYQGKHPTLLRIAPKCELG